jgi:hypothetical protein
MGINRTAKSGDYKRALTELNNRGGIIEGTPNSILIALGFDGKWNEFKSNISAAVVKTELGRYAVKISEEQEHNSYQDNKETLSATNPIIFAMCASAYILGEGDSDDFEGYTGEYESLQEVIAPLASEIDSSIGGIYFPYQTEEDIEVYAVERSLLYTASGDGLFTLYGSAVLAHTQS